MTFRFVRRQALLTQAGMLTMAPVMAILLLNALSPAPSQASQPFAPDEHRVYIPLAIKSSPMASPTVSFGYGISVANIDNYGLVEGMGFSYVKAYLSWATSEPQKGVYQWVTAPTENDANNLATAAEQHGLKLILRVDTPPSWAKSGPGNAPPDEPRDFGDFMGALAAYLKGRVVAYELWNEPNLSAEWGGLPPDPERYVELLKAAYPRIKASDPDAIVVAAGLATTGANSSTAMDDLTFLRRMYAVGARSYFDVLGSRPYGFATAPEEMSADGVSHFRRAEAQRQVMVENGDDDKLIWATEFGWLLDSPYDWPDRNWQKVSPETQANYLVRAYSYAYDNWPWMGVMAMFNLDFSTTGWYADSDPIVWYSILEPDGSPRPAYTALSAMPKPTR